MRQLRRSLLLHVSVAGLLGSLGLGLVAPAATAGERTHMLALDSLPRLVGAIPSEVIEAALAARAAPAAFADALVAALGGDAPAAEQVLDALYGQLLQVFRLEQGTPAVFVTAGSASPAGVVNAGAAHRMAAAAPGAGKALPGLVLPETVRLPAPRHLRPAIQALGP